MKKVILALGIIAACGYACNKDGDDVCYTCVTDSLDLGDYCGPDDEAARASADTIYGYDLRKKSVFDSLCFRR